LAAAAGAAVMMALVTPVAQADSISSVENARAKDRAGYYLSRQDREKLRQYGRESDPGWGFRGYDGGYVYYGPRRYYRPYGYRPYGY
jgi:hypothetical protein